MKREEVSWHRLQGVGGEALSCKISSSEQRAGSVRGNWDVSVVLFCLHTLRLKASSSRIWVWNGRTYSKVEKKQFYGIVLQVHFNGFHDGLFWIWLQLLAHFVRAWPMANQLSLLYLKATGHSFHFQPIYTSSLWGICGWKLWLKGVSWTSRKDRSKAITF